MAKAIKETTEAIESQEVPVKKKRASGKRKPKPKIEEVPKEELSSTDQITEAQTEKTAGVDATEILTNILTEEVEKLDEQKGMPEVMQIPTKVLSKQADGWKKWLALQRMTPDDFIKRYPNHKMKHFIQEIIDFEAEK